MESTRNLKGQPKISCFDRVQNSDKWLKTNKCVDKQSKYR